MKRLLAVFIGLLCLLTGLCGCGPGAPESSAASREESAVSAPFPGRNDRFDDPDKAHRTRRRLR